MKWGVIGALLVSTVAFGMSFWGTWDMTLQVLPSLTIYRSNLTLDASLVPGWKIESESKFYTGGVLRYQNFYFSGQLGDFGVWGKIYFNAQDVRYQKLWVNAEIPLWDGKLRFSFDHWSTKDDYTTVIPVEALFPWTSDPSAPARSFYENKYYTVYGTIVAYYRASTYLNLYMVDDYPRQRFIIYVVFSDIPEADLKAWLGVTDWEELRGKTVWVYGKVVNYESPTGVQNPEIRLYSLAYTRDYRLKNIGLGIPEPSSDEKMFGPWPCASPVTNVVAASTVIQNKNAYVGKTYYVYGTIKGFSPSAPASSVTLYLESTTSGQRFLIFASGSGLVSAVKAALGVTQWSDAINKKVWAYGPIILYGSAQEPEIQIYGIAGVFGVGDPPSSQISTGPFLDWRLHYTFGQYTFTADFWDCCTGTGLGRVTFEAKAIPCLCCGLYADLSLTFTKASGLEKLAFSLGDLSLCCGITLKISGEFAPTYKMVKLEPKWAGLAGCLMVYGDVVSQNNSISGVELYGIDLICYAGNVKMRAITAFNPAKVEELTDIAFYLGEFEYWELGYADTGCCGGNLDFTASAWFGTRGVLFGLQRFKVRLDVPVASNVTVFAEGHWNLALPSPLLWFDLGTKISF